MFLIWRHHPAVFSDALTDHSPFLDQWRVGPLRVPNGVALGLVLTPALLQMSQRLRLRRLALLDRSSLQVFVLTTHIPVCVLADALIGPPRPKVPTVLEQASVVALMPVVMLAVAWRSDAVRGAHGPRAWVRSTDVFEGGHDPRSAAPIPESLMPKTYAKCRHLPSNSRSSLENRAPLQAVMIQLVQCVTGRSEDMEYGRSMCERYVLPDQDLAERELSPQCKWWRFSASFNVAPTRYVPAVRLYDGQSEAIMMRWGLTPAWANGDSSAGLWLRLAGGALENSPLFRGPWLNSQRCILPFAGFYTWRRTPAGYRQPYFVHLTGRKVFAVAGIWDRTETEDGDVIEGCAILTVPACAPIESIQSATHEMPAIIEADDFETWLRGTPVEARALLRTAPEELLASHAVSPRINSLECDDPELVREVGHLSASLTGRSTNSQSWL